MRRMLKISAWTLGSLVLLVVLLFAALLITGNTDGGRRLIERLTARFSDGHVELSQLAGSFPSALDLERLQLSDDKGIWLTAEHISLRWSPLALLARHVEVQSLTVARLHIERAPVSKPKKKPSHFSVPHTDIAKVSVETLELGAALAGQPASLVVHGDAHLLSLQDATATVVAQRTGGVGDYELHLHFDPARMDATLKVQEPANGPLENILSLPGLGDLSMLAKVGGPRTAENIELTLAAGALHGRVQGTVNIPETSAELEYAFDAPQMSPSPTLSWQSLSLHGRWHGPLAQAVADGTLQARQLQVPGGLEVAALTANLTASRGELSLRSSMEGLVLPGPQPQLLQDSPLEVSGSMRLDQKTRPAQFSAQHRLFTLSGHAVTAGEQSAQLELRLPDIAPFAAVAGQKARGTALIKGQLARDNTTTRLTADVTGRVDGGRAAWAGLLRGADTKLQLSAAVNEKELDIQRLTLTGAALSVSASGTASRSETRDVNLRVDLGLPDLAKVSPAFAGTLKSSGKISGPTDNLAADVQLTSTLSVRGSPVGTVTASLRANGLPKAPRGTVSAQGSLDGAPLVLDVSVAQEAKNTMHAIVHHADWKSAHINGDLSTSTDIEHAVGALKVEMSQLADLDRLLGTGLKGGIFGQLALRPGKGSSSAQIKLEAREVSTGTLTGNAQLDASGTMDALEVNLAAQSPDVGGLPAEVTSMSRLNMGAHQLELNRLEAHYHDQKLALLSPSKISFAEGLSIDHLRLGAQEAVLEVDGRISPTLDLRASVKQVKPDLVNAFVPNLLASGTLQADANVKGSTSAPQGEIHAEAIGVRSKSDVARGLPAVDLHSSARLMGNAARVDAKLTAGKTSQLTLSGNAPLAPDGALDLKLAGMIDLSLMNPLTEASGKHVTGQLSIDTTVTGAAANPEIGGTVRVAKGGVRDYTQGINLTDITATLSGDHGLLRIEMVTARAAPGDVIVTGTVGVLQKGIPVDLLMVAKNAQPIASNIVTANIDSQITIKGMARERLDVAGKVSVNRADVQIPNGLPPNVAVLDVRKPGRAPPKPSEKPLVIGLNLTLDAPRQILVKGRGLDAELGGEMRVRGTTDAPTVSGGFELLRGTFTLASSRLTFSQGTVTFNGAGLKNRIDPTLDFTAQTMVADVTATVRITGLADQPKIELSSTPDLPQDEILARLLFGVSASQLTALQVVQIGAALASLGGGGGGFNPLEKIQKSLGLDRLTVSGASSGGAPGSPAKDNGASIEAGRYVSSRVFVGVKESTTGNTQLGVDVDLAKRLKLQAKLGNGQNSAQGTTPENDPGSSIGIAYQWEY
jgi:translocation and assembly module TamB